MFSVSITEKGGAPRNMDFDKPEVHIGRVQGNDIILPKGNVSKRHARIVLKEGRLIIVDLKSTNGTYVNGERLTSPVRLSHNDAVNLGGAATMNFSVIAIAVNEEEFYSLVLKELTNQATVEDREELEDMLEQKAELRAEFEHLKLGAVVSRSALLAMQAIGSTAQSTSAS